MSQGGILPKKEAMMFRTVIECYEKKLYQKGVKTADNILKKFPDHGETQAMKGIIYNCMNRKEEAYELVKSGLRNNVRSHICWHVYGLLYRSDGNYKEAIKCYLNALRLDSSNQNIYRDLSWLQVQMRDIAGFVATRKTILEARPTFRVSWITYAAACYLNSDYISAAETITTCAKTITEAIEPYEQSEMLLFLNLCLEKQNKFTEAIDHLKSNESSIVDKLSYSTKLAELYQLSGNYEEAKKAWLELVVSQPQNYRYHCGMQAAYLELPREISEKMLALKRLNLPSTVLDLSAEQQKLLYTVYEEQKFKSKLIEKIELTILTGEKFKTTLDSYLRKCLAEGMPALYHDVCDLVRKADINSSGEKVLVKDPTEFKNHKVVGVVLEILDSYIANLKTSSSFDGVSEAKKESPQTLLWALFLKCHMKEMSGELLEALTIIDECIEHTPTALDMITKKAKIEKKIGNYLDAAITMDDCRVLDLQDRYLNNKATKYFLLADEVQLGMNTIAMFTKHDGDSQKILYDLQCNWYELELADSYCRKKQWGQALKQFYAVRKHFYDYYDDLFDFHGFCMRKMTVRAYLNEFNTLSTIYSHKFYQRALRGALKVFIHLIDCPEDVDGLGHLSAAERKKEREKLKKAKKKREKAEEAKELAMKEDAKWNGKAGEDDKSKDEGEDGEKLLQKDFLVECEAWCTPIQNYLSLCDCETIALYAEANMKRGQYNLVIDAINIGTSKNSLDPSIMAVTAKFAVALKEAKPKKVSITVAELTAVKEEMRKLLGNPQFDVMPSLEKFIQYAIDSASLSHVIGAVKSFKAVNAKGDQYLDRIEQLLTLPKLLKDGGIKFASVSSAIKTLQDLYPDKPFTSAFIERAKTFYPKATFFEESPKQVKAKRSEEKKFLSTLDTFDSDTTEAVVAPKIDEDTPTTHE